MRRVVRQARSFDLNEAAIGPPASSAPDPLLRPISGYGVARFRQCARTQEVAPAIAPSIFAIRSASRRLRTALGWTHELLRYALSHPSSGRRSEYATVRSSSTWKIGAGVEAEEPTVELKSG